MGKEETHTTPTYQAPYLLIRQVSPHGRLAFLRLEVGQVRVPFLLKRGQNVGFRGFVRPEFGLDVLVACCVGFGFGWVGGWVVDGVSSLSLLPSFVVHLLAFPDPSAHAHLSLSLSLHLYNNCLGVWAGLASLLTYLACGGGVEGFACAAARWPGTGRRLGAAFFFAFIVRRRLSLRGDVGLLLVVVEGGWVGGWMVVCVMMRRVWAKKK